MWSYLKSFICEETTEQNESAISADLQREIIDIANSLEAKQQEELVGKDFTSKVVNVASLIPFSKDLIASYYCMMDVETPTKIKAAILLPLAYFVLPIDAVPDILPMIGYTDDAAIFMAALFQFSKYIKAQHYDKASALFAPCAQEENITEV